MGKKQIMMKQYEAKKEKVEAISAALIVAQEAVDAIEAQRKQAETEMGAAFEELMHVED